MRRVESRELTPGMRRLLQVAGVLVALAGIQLFVFSERTDRFFAWTIDPPLTAAFLGASYWSSVVFEWTAAKERLWANARIAVPTVFVFTATTLLVTLLHIENFHLGAEFETVTRAVTWAWIVIYAVVPVVMAVVWVRQQRLPGSDPGIDRNLPIPLRALVGAQALLLLGAGLVLLIDPTTAAGWWPWSLTPLTGRAIGAWGLSLGVAAVHALLEGELRRLRPAATAYIAFSLLQGWALVRHGEDLSGGARAFVYYGFLASIFLAGAWALVSSKRPAVSQ